MSTTRSPNVAGEFLPWNQQTQWVFHEAVHWGLFRVRGKENEIKIEKERGGKGVNENEVQREGGKKEQKEKEGKKEERRRKKRRNREKINSSKI